jgi:hypothetical protein
MVETPQEAVSRLEEQLRYQLENPRKNPEKQQETVRELREALERARLRSSGRMEEADILEQKQSIQSEEKKIAAAVESARKANIERIERGQQPYIYRIRGRQSTFVGEEQPRRTQAYPIIAGEGQRYYQDSHGRIKDRLTGNVVKERIVLSSPVGIIPVGSKVDVTRTGEGIFFSTVDERKTPEKEVTAFVTQSRPEVIKRRAEKGDIVAIRAAKYLGIEVSPQNPNKIEDNEVSIVSERKGDFGQRIAVDSSGKEYIVIPSKYSEKNILVEKSSFDKFVNEEKERLMESQKAIRDFESLNPPTKAFLQSLEVVGLATDKVIEKISGAIEKKQYSSRPSKTLFKEKKDIIPDQSKEIKKSGKQIIRFFSETLPGETRERAISTIQARNELFKYGIYTERGQEAALKVLTPTVSTASVLYLIGARSVSPFPIVTIPLIKQLPKVISISKTGIKSGLTGAFTGIAAKGASSVKYLPEAGFTAFGVAVAAKQPTPLNIGLAALPFAARGSSILKLPGTIPKVKTVQKFPNNLRIEKGFATLENRVGFGLQKFGKGENQRGEVFFSSQVSPSGKIKEGQEIIRIVTGSKREFKRKSQGSIDRFLSMTGAIPKGSLFKGLEINFGFKPLIVGGYTGKPNPNPIYIFLDLKRFLPYSKLKFKSERPNLYELEKTIGERQVFKFQPDISKNIGPTIIYERVIPAGESAERRILIKGAVKAFKKGSGGIQFRSEKTYILKPSKHEIKGYRIQKIAVEGKDAGVVFKRPPTADEIRILTFLERKGKIKIIYEKKPEKLEGIFGTVSMEGPNIKGYKIIQKGFSSQEVLASNPLNLISRTYRFDKSGKKLKLSNVDIPGYFKDEIPGIKGKKSFYVQDTQFQNLFSKDFKQVKRIGYVDIGRTKLNYFESFDVGSKEISQVSKRFKKVAQSLYKDSKLGMEKYGVVVRNIRYTSPKPEDKKIFSERFQKKPVSEFKDESSLVEIKPSGKEGLKILSKKTPESMTYGGGFPQAKKVNLDESLDLIPLQFTNPIKFRPDVEFSGGFKSGFLFPIIGSIGETPKTSTNIKSDIFTELKPRPSNVIKPNVRLGASNNLSTNLNARLNTRLNTNLNTRLNTNLNTRLNTNLNTRLNTNLNTRLNTNLNTRLNTNLNTRLNTRLNTNLTTKITTNIRMTTLNLPPIFKLNKKVGDVKKSNLIRQHVVPKLFRYGRKKERIIPDLLSAFQSRLLFGRATIPKTTEKRLIKALRSPGFRVQTMEQERSPNLTFGFRFVRGRGLQFGTRRRERVLSHSVWI